MEAIAAEVKALRAQAETITVAELVKQGESLAANYTPGPRNAIPQLDAQVAQGQRAAILAQFPTLNESLIPKIIEPPVPGARSATLIIHVNSQGVFQAAHALSDESKVPRFMRDTYADFVKHETEPFYSCFLDKVYIARVPIQ